MFFKKSPDKNDIINALQPFIDSTSIDGVVFQNGQILVTLEIDPAQRMILEKQIPEMESALRRLKAVKQARIILTAAKPPEKPVAAAPVEIARAVAPQVKRIIAVASGKGGVGKSTVAVNLALAFQQSGWKTGLLDADVYGPSVPMLLGLRDKKPENRDDYLIPVDAFGLKVMSMGFMVPENTPMVWRGPMVQSALLQMLRDVQWGDLDVLVIDMPPGTGDTQLTIAQKVKLAGAVIVSTPQDIALLDTVKGIHMFEKVSVPVLGVIENMSFFCCPHCGETSDIFGTHGARDRAAELNVDFLGGIPIDIDLRRASDTGKPLTLQTEHPVTAIFSDLVQKLRDRLLDSSMGKSGQNKPMPKIIIEPASRD